MTRLKKQRVAGSSGMETVAPPRLESRASADLKCPRCGSKGEIQAFRHRLAGVCFECWGTGNSFRLEEALLTRNLTVLRAAYVKARRAGLPVDEIVVAGKAAAAALEKHRIDSAAYAKTIQTRYGN